MASRKNPEPKSEPNITDAAEKAGLLIRGLQSRLRVRADQVVVDPVYASEAVENPDDLERELEELFKRSAGAEPSPGASHAASSQPSPLASPASRDEAPFHELRERVVEAAAERIFEDWESHPETMPALEAEVVERLVRRILERLRGGGR